MWQTRRRLRSGSGGSRALLSPSALKVYNVHLVKTYGVDVRCPQMHAQIYKPATLLGVHFGDAHKLITQPPQSHV